MCLSVCHRPTDPALRLPPRQIRQIQQLIWRPAHPVYSDLRLALVWLDQSCTHTDTHTYDAAITRAPTALQSQTTCSVQTCNSSSSSREPSGAIELISAGPFSHLLKSCDQRRGHNDSHKGRTEHAQMAGPDDHERDSR